MNELKAVWRNVGRNRFYSAVNVFGLTVGLTACLLVTTVIVDELSYDKQWSRADRIFRIISINKVGEGLYNQNPYSFAGLSPALKKNFPEVEDYTSLSPGEVPFQLGDEKNEAVRTNVLMADTAIFLILDIQVAAGNPRAYRQGIPNLVLTRSFAEKYFRGKNPIGQTLYDKAIYKAEPTKYLITGIIEDLPANSHLRAEVVVLGERYKEVLNPKQAGTMSTHYLLMRSGSDMQVFTQKVNKWYKAFTTASNPLEHAFQPLSKIYLDSPFAANQKVRGDRQRIIIFSAVAALLIIIACINFINLSTSRAASRMGDTCIRKILGAERMHIVRRVLVEALLFFGTASVLALYLYGLAMPTVEGYLGYALGKTVFSYPLLTGAILGALVVAALISGSYPAWLISGFKPGGIFKGSLMSNRKARRPTMRQALVVMQFALCVCILIAMIVVHRQLKYVESADVGFNHHNLLNIGFISWDDKGEFFKNELNRIPGVISSSHCLWAPTKGPGYSSTEIDDPSRPGYKTTIWHISGDVDFVKTLGLRLLDGRFLTNRVRGDMAAKNSLITATTAKLLRIQQLNKPLDNIGVNPVGIISDFHTNSFREPLGPTVVSADSVVPYGINAAWG